MELNGTQLVVLGMLRLGARTGYDVKGAVERSTRFFYNASYGQIYPELKRLESLGLVASEPAARDGRPRTAYRLTEAGEDTLHEWLRSPSAYAELRDENLLKLFFADILPREEALDILRERRRQHEDFLHVLEQIEARPGEDPPFVGLVLRYGLDFARWVIEWCDEQERRLA